MRVLTLDCEHSYGAMRPYDKDFVLTNIGLVDNENNVGVVWINHLTETPTDHWEQIVQAHIDWADIVVAHNLKHDMTILRYYGISFENVQLYCTMVTEYLLSGQNTRERSFSLDAVAEYYDLGHKTDKMKAYWESGVPTANIPEWILTEYVVQDCTLTRDIYNRQQEMIDLQKMRPLIELQNEFTISLSDMELNGFKFDAETGMRIVEEQATLLTGLEIELKGIAGHDHLNIGSNQQLSALLYGGSLKTQHKEWVVKELKSKPESLYREVTILNEKQIEGLGFSPLPRTLRVDNYFKTDKETIGKLKAVTSEQKRVKEILLEYSVAKKAKESILGKTETKGLINKIRSDGKIHPNFNQTVTATGRLSASDPNSQNFPRGTTSPIKECIVPTLDGLLQVDLSQIEWRVAAELSGDPVMLAEINAGIDQHARAVVELMELCFINKDDPESKQNRNHAKFFNFRMIYGGTAYGFYMDAKMPNFPLKKWEQIVTNFYNKYKVLKQWQDDNVVEVEKRGFLRSPTGRLFMFHKINRKAGLDVYNDRQVKNYPVQGIAGGDVLPMACVIIRRGLQAGAYNSKLILTVHDSIVFDYEDAELQRLIQLCNRVVNHLRGYLTRYYKVTWLGKVEGEIEIGKNYANLKEISPN